MQIDIKTLTDTTKFVGNDFWICDFRQPDLNKKPARNVKPKKCRLLPMDEAKKKIYYSMTFFKELDSKGNPIKSSEISIFDNTGYRCRTGEPIKVFDTEWECIQAYNDMCDEVLNVLFKKRSTAVQEINHAINIIANQKC